MTSTKRLNSRIFTAICGQHEKTTTARTASQTGRSQVGVEEPVRLWALVVGGGWYLEGDEEEDDERAVEGLGGGAEAVGGVGGEPLDGTVVELARAEDEEQRHGVLAAARTTRP